MDSVKINNEIGSSTAVLATFDSNTNDKILTTNLGDSGYLILRPHDKKTRNLSTIFKSKQ